MSTTTAAASSIQPCLSAPPATTTTNKNNKNINNTNTLGSRTNSFNSTKSLNIYRNDSGAADDDDDEDPMKDFQLLRNSNMVYGQISKQGSISSITSSFTNGGNGSSVVVANNSSSIMKTKEDNAGGDDESDVPVADNNNNNNHNNDVVDDDDDDDESGVEVMPYDDMKRIREELRPSFSGIPMPPPLQHRSSLVQRTKIDPSHPQYELAVGMMLGIRESVSGMEELEKEAEWTEGDFTTDLLQKECRRNRNYTFPNSKFKAYAPLVFSRLRRHLDKNLFLHSVCGNFRYLEFLSNAKSGSFFFFSHDGKYLIKTLTMQETHFLVNDVLPTYYHFLQTNPASFIAKFYGLYRIQLKKDDKPLYFSIMQSVFCDAPLSMNYTFDLKGSTLGRRAKPGETVGKDLDVGDRRLRLDAPVRTELLAQLRRDVTLLARLGIMDYSFLLGICDDAAVQDLHITPHKGRESRGEEDDDDDDDEATTSNSSIPNHLACTKEEDEFIDWSELDWFRRSTCTDDCSVTSSLDFFTGGGASSPTATTTTTTPDNLLSVRHDCPALSQKLRHGCLLSSDGTELYYAGIIDILQCYNVKKWGETVLRQIQGNPHQSISCVDPESYATRFISFLSKIIISIECGECDDEEEMNNNYDDERDKSE